MSFDKQASKKMEKYSKERKDLQTKGLLPDWYTSQGWKMFKKKYAVKTEQRGVRHRFQTIASVARHLPEQYQEEYQQKFFNLFWTGTLIPSSPVMSNTGTDRGMVVSCSGQYIDDSVESFYSGLRETAILSKNAFGTSGSFTAVRPRGAPFSNGEGKANGVKDVIDDFFTCAEKISQGGTRKGSFAAYIDIESEDLEECLNSLKTRSNGKNYGWIVRDSFIEKLKVADPDAMHRFTEVLYTKLTTGKGYFFFKDKADRHRPQMYKDLGLDIVATNLCTEIMLHSSPEYTYSCILSSLNLLRWDEIKSSDAVFTATVFLDCICSEFIEQGKDIAGLEKVVEFTRLGRAIGLGVMGFATYLQTKMIPYESVMAGVLNRQIFKHIQAESLRASQWLAEVLGEPEWCKGYGVRNTHRTTLPPTKSSSLLAGNMSESVFPDPGMVFEASSVVGELPRIVGPFYELMKERGQYSPETLKDIIDHAGSVQHLDWLTPEEKLVYKTAYEIDQHVILRYASERQPYLCQGQSLNFYVPEDGSEDLVAELMTLTFTDPNILSQYYIYSRSGVIVKDECVACAA